MPERIILVNERDKKTGIGEKIEIHKKGLLHRAFSIFIFNKKNELLIQKRAKTKYHSAGLWTNTCCSHPWPGEKLISAAKRRLNEEMGIKTKLKWLTKIRYFAKVGNLIENEIDHIFIGYFEGMPVLNKTEVENWKWEKVDFLLNDIKKNPQKYSAWFKIILPQVIKLLRI